MEIEIGKQILDYEKIKQSEINNMNSLYDLIYYKESPNIDIFDTQIDLYNSDIQLAKIYTKILQPMFIKSKLLKYELIHHRFIPQKMYLDEFSKLALFSLNKYTIHNYKQYLDDIWCAYEDSNYVIFTNTMSIYNFKKKKVTIFIDNLADKIQSLVNNITVKWNTDNYNDIIKIYIICKIDN
jgi:hypothetical protein